MKKEFLDYIEDIIDAMNKASDFIKNMDYDTFTKDNKTVYAVIRALEIIGEATKNIPIEIKNSYPNVPWREMAGMRDKVIHEYFGVNLKRVWSTANVDIPTLKPIFKEILEKAKK